MLREAISTVPGLGAGTTLRVLLDALDEGIVVCDARGNVLIANREAKALQGLPTDEDLVGQPFPYSPALCSSDGSPLTEAHHPMSRALQGTVVRSEQLQLAGDDRRHLVASAKPFELEDGSVGALLVMRDVTSQLEEEAWLMHLALHDPLTGLANRYLLLDYLRRVLLQFRTRGGSIALVFLDLDDFKMINDRFGHDVGDEVLVAVGRRIQGAVRSSDIVARLGGDEFVVAHAASDDPGEIEMVISRIRKTLTAPYQVRGQTLTVSASIGWVAADPRHEDPTTLLVRADREMYRRKSARHRAAEAAGS
jgi:diguanylate cyclase (GGDEF)-like protein